jgi:hypothetical protein
MRRIAIQIGLILALIAFALPARAIELITIERPFRAHHLAGVIVDSTGATVSGVLIEDCDPTYKHVLASATTDVTGHFAFPVGKIGSIHFLHVRINGFDPMQITVQLRRFAKGNLRIRLYIAT